MDLGNRLPKVFFWICGDIRLSLSVLFFSTYDYMFDICAVIKLFVLVVLGISMLYERETWARECHGGLSRVSSLL